MDVRREIELRPDNARATRAERQAQRPSIEANNGRGSTPSFIVGPSGTYISPVCSRSRALRLGVPQWGPVARKAGCSSLMDQGSYHGLLAKRSWPIGIWLSFVDCTIWWSVRGGGCLFRVGIGGQGLAVMPIYNLVVAQNCRCAQGRRMSWFQPFRAASSADRCCVADRPSPENQGVFCVACLCRKW